MVNCQCLLVTSQSVRVPSSGLKVLTFHHLPPSPDPSLVSNAAPTKSSACRRIKSGNVPVSPIGTTGSLPRIDSTGKHKRPVSVGHAYAHKQYRIGSPLQLHPSYHHCVLGTRCAGPTLCTGTCSTGFTTSPSRSALSAQQEVCFRDGNCNRRTSFIRCGSVRCCLCTTSCP